MIKYIRKKGENMPNNINEEINKLVIEIKKILGKRIKKIILYGSYARGDYNKNSDVDIMILTDLNNDEIVQYRQKIWDYVADIEIDKGIIINPLIKNIDEFNSWSDTIPFYNNIIKEGKVINE